MSDAKKRILDAAEQLFAARGYDAVALRALTAQAGTNLAAVNYHFGDKSAVYREVIIRRLRPLNQQRLARLETVCAQEGPAPPPLDKIIRILAQPVFALHDSPAAGDRHFVQILARLHTDVHGFSEQLRADEFYPLLNRFGQIIRRHALQLSPEEFLWRYSFLVGAMNHALATLPRMAALTRGICPDNDSRAVLARFVAHAVTTIKAPSAPRPLTTEWQGPEE